MSIERSKRADVHAQRLKAGTRDGWFLFPDLMGNPYWPFLLLLFRETVANNAPCIPSISIQSIGIEHFFRCKSATFVLCNNNRYRKVSRKIFPKIYQQSEKNNFTPGMRLFRKPLNNKFGNTGRVLMEVPPLIFTRNSHRRRKTCQPISRKAIDARFCSHP